MLTTLKEAKESTLQDIAGVCVSGDKFLRLLNDSTQMLMRRGDWPGTVVPIQVCAYRGCVVMPRYVGQIRKINVCNYPILNQNFWWGFLSDAAHNVDSWWNRWCGRQASLIGGQQTPVFQDVAGEGRYVRFYPQYQNDLGKKITVFGVDNDGQTLRHKNTSDEWVEGIELILATPFVSSSTYVRRIDRILKEQTEGDVWAYGYDAANNVLETIGVYEPSDLNPSFTRSTLTIPQCGSSCGDTTSIAAIVKFRFIPAKVDNDLVLIQNLQALKYQMQGVKASDAGETRRAREFFASAVNELNADLRDTFDETAIPVDLGELGRNSGIGRQQMF